MHGIGNDYVYVNGFEEKVEDAPSVSRFVSDRHFGIGSDGLIIIRPSDRADCEMEMYNADGSRGKMCGNGIRCVAKYVYDHDIVKKTTLTVDTLAGVRTLQLHVKDGKTESVRVDMGAPVLEPSLIPVRVCGAVQEKPHVTVDPAFGRIIRDAEILTYRGSILRGTCVSMGNPHVVVPVDDVDSFDVAGIGPLFEKNEIFPERVNTEFIRVLTPAQVQMRVWERGSGETWACGTGACAVAVACILNGWTADRVTVHLRGGDLEIEWDREKNTVFMTGSATEVFSGEIELV